jgi:hypothetical protein
MKARKRRSIEPASIPTSRHFNLTAQLTILFIFANEWPSEAGFPRCPKSNEHEVEQEIHLLQRYAHPLLDHDAGKQVRLDAEYLIGESLLLPYIHHPYFGDALSRGFERNSARLPLTREMPIAVAFVSWALSRASVPGVPKLPFFTVRE